MKNDFFNPYKVLGVKSDASPEQIKEAYRKLAIEWYPDKNGVSKESSDKQKDLNRAKEILFDPVQKATVDKKIRAQKERRQQIRKKRAAAKKKAQEQKQAAGPSVEREPSTRHRHQVRNDAPRALQYVPRAPAAAYSQPQTGSFWGSLFVVGAGLWLVANEFNPPSRRRR